ncbi:Dihydrouridine synthase (Dus) family protein [Cryptosporidium meleagridis]|uniref:tRNA-dihydrouridine(16/17) synthase [NAD(P)(+)] n=1 Tax=Cryptosporidium meleagridis TaxID=93969 RepID=A0A2P4YWQ5_9CRYT|nr:Dihydrouridine synthase (Dus) family protein [Cryptosporidium meleagridis]
MTKLSPWENWKNVLKSPKTVLAPMVDGSELAFRLVCKKYGCDLTYSPMYHSGLFSKLQGYRETNFQTCEEDDPMIVQFCGNDPETLLKASKFIDDKVKGIDINFGCPQNIAKRGNYGAFLLSNPDLMERIISKLSESDLKCPVSCKIRILDHHDLQQTINLIKRLESAGACMIAVHARTMNSRGVLTGPANWEALKILKSRCSIPFIANGGISNYEDIQKCLNYTGADAVMSAEGILENPWLFQGFKTPEAINNKPSQFQIALEYLDYCILYPPPNVGIIRTHLYRIFHTIFSLPGAHIFRDEINNSYQIQEFQLFVRNLENFYNSKIVHELRNYPGKIPQFGFWYIRHRHDKLDHNVTKELISIYNFQQQKLPAILQFNESVMTDVKVSNNLEIQSDDDISNLFYLL